MPMTTARLFSVQEAYNIGGDQPRSNLATRGIELLCTVDAVCCTDPLLRPHKEKCQDSKHSAEASNHSPAKTLEQEEHKHCGILEKLMQWKLKGLPRLLWKGSYIG